MASAPPAEAPPLFLLAAPPANAGPPPPPPAAQNGAAAPGGGYWPTTAGLSIWRWAGHLARYSDEFPPKAATLWMDYSSFLTFRKLCNFRMPDTRRVWRWETLVFSFCQTHLFANTFVGVIFHNNFWQTLAQDREFWQALEPHFVRLHAVHPRSEQIALEDVQAGVLMDLPGMDDYPL